MSDSSRPVSRWRMRNPSAAQLAAGWVPAWIGGRRDRRLFDEVRVFCLFLGYPKSGHSLVGALLDAHPDAAISHELHALKHTAAGYRRDQIYHLILENSRRFARGGRERGGYVYDVEGQWQGRHRRLRVVGDKKGEGTTQWLPSELGRLRRRIDARLRFIHVVRNPFDNISRIALRRERTLRDAADHYFGLCATVASLAPRFGPSELFELRHEDFVRDPATHLARLCTFLELEATPEYLAACTRVVAPAPHESRLEADWTSELVSEVGRRMRAFPFLDGYGWDG